MVKMVLTAAEAVRYGADAAYAAERNAEAEEYAVRVGEDVDLVSEEYKAGKVMKTTTLHQAVVAR